MHNELYSAIRSVRRAPAHAIAVVATLALGIGVASATGVIARTIAFAGLPIRDAERVVVLWGSDRAGSFTHLPIGPAAVPGLAEALRGIGRVAASDYNGASPYVFRAPNEPGRDFRLRGALAGGNFFDVLGARPTLGRGLLPSDDVIGAPRVLVLSHRAWQTHFGGDPRVIGRTFEAVQLGATMTVVGVMPPGLDYPRGVEFWSAFAPTAARNGSLEGSPYAVDAVVRLMPHATADQARLAMTSYYATLARAGKDVYLGARASVRTLPQLVVGDVRPLFATVSAAAGVVLLVTGGNVVALLLVRASRRRRELAVRAAIGAAPRRLMRALFGEHALLAALGGMVGAALAATLIGVFAAFAPAELPRVAEVGVDWSLVVAAIASTSLVVVTVGIAPALAASRVPPAESLGAAHVGAGGTTHDVTVRRTLVAAQIALSLVVLAGASLVGKSLHRLTSLDLGIPTAAHLAFFEIVVPSHVFDNATGNEDPVRAIRRWRTTQTQILERIGATPGITAVAPVSATPFAGVGGWDGRLAAEDAAPSDSARRPYLNLEVTNEDYTRVTEVPLIRGRWIASSDVEGSPPVVVLSERAAQILYPGTDAIGRRVKGWSDTLATIVGIVRDTRYRDYIDPRPTVYIPYRQFDAGALYLAVRATVDPATLVTAVRTAVRESAPSLLVQERGTIRTLMAAPLARPRIVAAVLALFAVVVVLLSVAGLYAVVAGSVGTRRREFSVRAALGATPGGLASLVLREGMVVAAAGVVMGLAGAMSGARLLSALLYDVSPTDPWTLVVVVAGLLGICAFAVSLPALRAAHADPARDLRTE